MSKNLRQEVLELLREDFQAVIGEKVEEFIAAAAEGMKARVDVGINAVVSQAIAERLTEVKVLFPAWGDIEKVVREGRSRDRGPAELRGFIDGLRIPLLEVLSRAELPEDAVPLSILGRNVPVDLNMELHFTTRQRETPILQYVTGAMLAKLTVVPILKAAVCHFVEVRTDANEPLDSQSELIMQYVYYPQI